MEPPNTPGGFSNQTPKVYSNKTKASMSQYSASFGTPKAMELSTPLRDLFLTVDTIPPKLFRADRAFEADDSEDEEAEIMDPWGRGFRATAPDIALPATTQSLANLYSDTAHPRPFISLYANRETAEAQIVSLRRAENGKIVDDGGGSSMELYHIAGIKLVKSGAKVVLVKDLKDSEEWKATHEKTGEVLVWSEVPLDAVDDSTKYTQIREVKEKELELVERKRDLDERDRVLNERERDLNRRARELEEWKTKHEKGGWMGILHQEHSDTDNGFQSGQESLPRTPIGRRGRVISSMSKPDRVLRSKPVWREISSSPEKITKMSKAAGASPTKQKKPTNKKPDEFTYEVKEVHKHKRGVDKENFKCVMFWLEWAGDWPGQQFEWQSQFQLIPETLEYYWTKAEEAARGGVAAARVAADREYAEKMFVEKERVEVAGAAERGKKWKGN